MGAAQAAPRLSPLLDTVSRSGAVPELPQEGGQLVQGHAHAPHDVHDLLILGFPVLLFQLFQPGLLLVDLGLDFLHLGHNFRAFADRH